MAAHARSTLAPIVDLTTPRKQAEPRFTIGIIEKLATSTINTSEEVCGTSFDWLATQFANRHEALEYLISVGSFLRGA